MKCKDPECNRKCGCCDEEEMTPEVLPAVAAERVEFGDPTGMAGSVPGERELSAQRGGCPYDAAAKKRGKFDLQAVVGAAPSVGEVVVARGEVGELASTDGNKGTVEFARWRSPAARAPGPTSTASTATPSRCAPRVT